MTKQPTMDAALIEKRRIDLLNRLETEAHPLSIFHNLECAEHIAFTLSESAALSIRQGLWHHSRRNNESSALATVKIAAMTPDKTKAVYEVKKFVFETIGTVDRVMAVERDILNAGEIEIHTHISKAPDYLGQTDVGDLIAAVAGPAWVHPTSRTMLSALRIFGILSIYRDHIAELQFYQHDMRESLFAKNNYGLKRLGMPVLLPNAF